MNDSFASLPVSASVSVDTSNNHFLFRVTLHVAMPSNVESLLLRTIIQMRMRRASKPGE